MFEVRRSILIVDDNATDTELLARPLRDHHVLHFALNGQNALETIEKNRVELVLLDIRMPVLDGFETPDQMPELANLRPRQDQESSAAL